MWSKRKKCIGYKNGKGMVELIEGDGVMAERRGIRDEEI